MEEQYWPFAANYITHKELLRLGVGRACSYDNMPFGGRVMAKRRSWHRRGSFGLSARAGSVGIEMERRHGVGWTDKNWEGKSARGARGRYELGWVVGAKKGRLATLMWRRVHSTVKRHDFKRLESRRTAVSPATGMSVTGPFV